MRHAGSETDISRKGAKETDVLSPASDAISKTASKSTTQKILDTVERIGNGVPHPVVIFLILIAVVVVLSHILYMLCKKLTGCA